MLREGRSRARGCILFVLLSASCLPAAAHAIDCYGNRISYVETGNGDDITDVCNMGTISAICQQPTLAQPVYTFSAGCSPYFGTCNGSARVDAELPGNHNNGYNSSYSFATVDLQTLSGGFIGECGFPGQTITQDFGTATVTGHANCFSPGASTANLVAVACKNNGKCQKTFTVRLDFDAAAGCVIPPTEKCGTGDQTCRDCTAAGTPPDGSPPGFGGSGDPATGGAQLRYAGGGAGVPGFPGSDAWREEYTYYPTAPLQRASSRRPPSTGSTGRPTSSRGPTSGTGTISSRSTGPTARRSSSPTTRRPGTSRSSPWRARTAPLPGSSAPGRTTRTGRSRKSGREPTPRRQGPRSGASRTTARAS